MVRSGTKSEKTLLRFFHVFGQEHSAQIQFVCSEKWAPHLKFIAKKTPQALNIIGRFHINRKFNEAINEIRRGEVNQFKADGQENVLRSGRWLLLKRPENLSVKQTSRLDGLLNLIWRHSRVTCYTRTVSALTFRQFLDNWSKPKADLPAAQLRA